MGSTMNPMKNIPVELKRSTCTTITKSMPNEYNSGALEHHLTEKGLKRSHWLRWRNNGHGRTHSNYKTSSTRCNAESECGVSKSCKKP